MGDYWAEREMNIRLAKKERAAEEQEDEERKHAAVQRREAREAKREAEKKRRNPVDYDWKQRALMASKGKPAQAKNHFDPKYYDQAPDPIVEARMQMSEARRAAYAPDALNKDAGGWDHLAAYHPDVMLELVERKKIRDRVAEVRDKAMRRIAQRAADAEDPGVEAATVGTEAAP